MLASLIIKMKPRDDNAVIKKDYGSLFHGYMHSKLDTDYAYRLHNMPLNPYSQYSYFDKKKDVYIWKISTLNKEAKEKIIDKIFDDNVSSFTLTYHNLKVDIISKEIVDVCSYKDIADRYFLSNDTVRTADIQFLTPTTYKVHGHYTIFPYLSHMFISLYDKWNFYSGGISLKEDKLIQDLVEKVNMVKYNLKSTQFSMEGVKLDSFIGSIKLHCCGDDMLVNIYNMLLDFSHYSGIGAKTSISMGGVLVSRNYYKSVKK